MYDSFVEGLTDTREEMVTRPMDVLVIEKHSNLVHSITSFRIKKAPPIREDGGEQ